MPCKEIIRRTNGTWAANTSGNPEGKKKGMRNYITLHKLALEEGVREYLGEKKNADKLLAAIDNCLDTACGEDKKHKHDFVWSPHPNIPAFRAEVGL